MKKSFIALGAIALLAFASCKEDKKTPDPVPETPPVENPTPTPSPKTDAEKQDSDGTTVSVGKDGVQVNTKDGESKTDVNVSKNDASVEIKKPKN
ncbi:hypothetical protein D3C87_68050 [compost metagenome]